MRRGCRCRLKNANDELREDSIILPCWARSVLRTESRRKHAEQPREQASSQGRASSKGQWSAGGQP
eukprot:6192429-Pleurochrysis_carterae.AAC.1